MHGCGHAAGMILFGVLLKWLLVGRPQLTTKPRNVTRRVTVSRKRRDFHSPVVVCVLFLTLLTSGAPKVFGLADEWFTWNCEQP